MQILEYFGGKKGSIFNGNFQRIKYYNFWQKKLYYFVFLRAQPRMKYYLVKFYKNVYSCVYSAWEQMLELNELQRVRKLKVSGICCTFETDLSIEMASERQ